MASKQASPQAQSGQIEITQLPVAQLNDLKTQLDREIAHLTQSHTSLRTAQAKFRDCLSSISSGISASVASKPLLVPLTSSLYVPGRLTDAEHVLVDVGTGFFVEKDVASAKDFYERKVKDLGESLKDLEGVVNEKAKNAKSVEDVIRWKVMSQGQEGEGKESQG